MKLSGLVRAGLRFHRASHLGLALGVVVAAASLVGALVLGASVKESLRTAAEARIGQVTSALVGGERSFTLGLAEAIEQHLPGTRCAPIWLLAGTVGTPDGTRGADGVQILGVDASFFELGLGPVGGGAPQAKDAWANEALAARLGLDGELDLVCRLPAPSGMPRDMLLATRDDAGAVVRVRATRTIGDEYFGRFALHASGAAAPTLFVSRDALARELEVEGRANVMLCATEESEAALASALRAVWTPADAALDLREVRGGTEVELTSSRVFIDRPVIEALRSIEPAPLGVLTYFVNDLTHGDRATPYSMVAGLGAIDGGSVPPAYAALVPSAGALVANAWLADDLALSPGDDLVLSYFAFGEDRRLVEASTELRVDKVVPVAGAAADPDLAPNLPGLSGEDDCRDWDPGIPVDLDRIRDTDEAYWDEHAGTPKAFVSLDTALALWGNRFGELTAVRLPASQRADLDSALHESLDPGALGLYFADVAGRAEASLKTPTDFGGLFLGLSFFLIVGALILSALLFALATERRASEIGVLLAVGFRPREVLRVFLTEAAIVALAASAVGALFGLLYTGFLLHGLRTLWSGAVASAAIDFHAPTGTVLSGALLAWFASIGSVWLAVRRAFRASPIELLRARAGFVGSGVVGRPARDGLIAALFGLIGLAGFLFADSSSPAAPGVFFGIGAATLTAVLFAVRATLGRAARGASSFGSFSLAGLGRRNAARRLGRSVATVALLASGVFLLVSIAVHRKAPPSDPLERSSATGGFALVATTSLPLLYDLNSEEGRDAFALGEEELEGVSFVPLRVRDGDDASCLNLGAPQAPRILGVPPERLRSRGAFAFARTWQDREASWALLNEVFEDGAVPGIVDESSLRWTLKRSLGDDLEYRDELGQPLRVRIVATLADSLLQGNMMVAERAFVHRFPSESGHRFLLVDGPPERRAELTASLGRALSDLGVVLEEGGARVARFQAVQNTYLAIFQALGGLGLLLGAVGFGVLLLRHTFERRAELATVRALGFGRRDLGRYVAGEFVFLLVAAIGGGALAALVATLPVVSGAGWRLVTLGTLWTVALLLCGWLALIYATRRALGGSLADALRSE